MTPRTTRRRRSCRRRGLAPAAAALLAVLCLPAPPAAETVPEGAWFEHPFGGRRSYQGDWLVVCDEAGRGPCRAVQYVHLVDGGFFGKGRLSVNPDAEGGPVLTLWGRELDAAGTARRGLGIAIDGGPERVVDVRPGGPDGPGDPQKVTVPDAEGLIEAMRAGRWMHVRAAGAEEIYSLRGIAGALDAMEADREAFGPPSRRRAR
ncbi:invasion protein IalB [Hasllibacter halocynthiae]|uniref:Invasion protein IalB n=1 Tax=Hasllibacter halocynthiae TaxID=595589 RepID=A0A2T0X2S7_9RHOB|nr:hypothetical protein [Hasllibacter halocynthiae]PRY93262.1 invasion protein IalB [Hasllibacter halocynthiae]